jgi:hypothetical protein
LGGEFFVIKSYGLLHKRGDISQKKFHTHWKGPHAVHALTLVPVMRRYVQNHKAAKKYPGMEPPCDGAPEVWLLSIEEAAILGTMPEYINGAYIDEPNFMRVRSGGVMVREHVMIEGPPIGKKDRLTKVLYFLKRNPALSAEQFREQWMAHAGPLFVNQDHVRRYVKSPTLAQSYVHGDATYDGVEEVWWDTEAAFNKDKRGGGVDGEDQQLLLDTRATTAMFVDENRVFWPGLEEDE